MPLSKKPAAILLRPIPQPLPPEDFVIAVDQGTTGTKAYRLYASGRFEHVLSLQHRQILGSQCEGVAGQPATDSWVEHDADEILGHLSQSIEAAVAGGSGRCIGIGLDNQGETCVAFDKETGEPFGNALVWQDARTSDVVEAIKRGNNEGVVSSRSGLTLDSYFSASKLAWLLEHREGAAEAHARGTLGLCTIDAYHLYRLTERRRYATDVSTASRTSLMNLRTRKWDPELCALFGVPMSALPEILPTTADFGAVRGIPVTASVVDQTSSLYGHGCHGDSAASCKVTFGTGAFVLANTGTAPRRVDGLLSVAAWQLGADAPCVYALDGGVCALHDRTASRITVSHRCTRGAGTTRRQRSTGCAARASSRSTLHDRTSLCRIDASRRGASSQVHRAGRRLRRRGRLARRARRRLRARALGPRVPLLRPRRRGHVPRAAPRDDGPRHVPRAARGRRAAHAAGRARDGRRVGLCLRP